MRFLGLKSLPWAASVRSSSRLGRWIELALMFLLVVQIARLFWVMLAPTAAFGDWRPFAPAVPGPAARDALFTSFDPFNRQGAAGTAVQQVTSLPLKLYGIRLNEGSGQGTAIIADESGVQTTYSVGEEVAPGVTLKAVSFDHITLSRNGADETLYIDQSSSAPIAVPDGPSSPGLANMSGPGNANPVAITGEQLSSQALLSGIGFAPRTENGTITGVVLSPQGTSDVFARAGFRPGDTVMQVNGSPIRSTQDILSLRSSLKPGAHVTLMVERGAATVPIAIIVPDNK